MHFFEPVTQFATHDNISRELKKVDLFEVSTKLPVLGMEERSTSTAVASQPFVGPREAKHWHVLAPRQPRFRFVSSQVPGNTTKGQSALP